MQVQYETFVEERKCVGTRYWTTLNVLLFVLRHFVFCGWLSARFVLL